MIRKHMGKIVCVALLMLLVAVLPGSAFQTATIYATSESWIGPEPFNWFHTYAPYQTGVEDVIEIESGSSGCISFNFFHVLALSEISPNIKRIQPSTLRVTYYGSANLSNKAQFCLWWAIVDEDSKLEWLDMGCPGIEIWEGFPLIEPIYSSGADCTAVSGLIQDDNASLTAPYPVLEAVDVSPSYYAIVEWGVNKTDTTKLTVNLYFDSQESPLHPTKIDNIRYDAALFTGVLQALWYLLLPLVYVVSIALYYAKEKKTAPDTNEIVLIAVGFVLVAVLTPIALNVLYGA